MAYESLVCTREKNQIVIGAIFLYQAPILVTEEELRFICTAQRIGQGRARNKNLFDPRYVLAFDQDTVANLHFLTIQVVESALAHTPLSNIPLLHPRPEKRLE